MPTTSLSTTLLESVNIVLANLGESPVNTLSGGTLPQQVSLALNTIEEVSTDIQSKGWWFNQKTGSNYDTAANVVIYPSNTTNDWGSDIPEEARRYITIRASRIAQTRLIGSEELQKFSYNEELVSLAILQQAHVRNSNSVLDFNSFPAELRGLGMDEVMFLQGNVEEKIGTLRLGGELANIAKTKAETELLADQEALVAKQILTEVQNALKVIAETSLINDQEALVTKQALTEVQNALKVIAETSLINDQEALVIKQALTEVAKATDIGADTTIKGKQGLLIDKQAATELKNALKVVAETSLINDQEALVTNQAATELKKALDLVADTTIKGKQGSLIDNQAATELKNALKAVAETSLINDQEALVVKQALTEVAKATDLGADTTVKGKQGTLIDNQAATELKTALKLVADTTLVGKQGSLVDAQATDVAADTTLKGKQGTALDADTALKTSQKTQLDAQTAIEATAEKAFYDGVVAGTQDTYRDFAAEMRMIGIQESAFQQTPAYKKVEMLKDAAKLRAATLTNPQLATLVSEASTLAQIMRLIGEPPSYTSSSNSLGRIALETLRKTDEELQGRGWWFNTENDVTLSKETIFIVSGVGGHLHGTYSYNAIKGRYEHVQAGHSHYFSKTDTNGTNTAGVWSLSEEDSGGTFTTSHDSNVGTGAFPDPALFEGGTLVIEHKIAVPSNALSVETNQYDTVIKSVAGVDYLYNLKTKSYLLWGSDVLAKVIYKRAPEDTPKKYLEYLEVRVAILLTELYPQSGVDLQRLPKMEAELRAYFKDREFDDANYSVFDNIDTAARVGINRNYNLF